MCDVCSKAFLIYKAIKFGVRSEQLKIKKWLLVIDDNVYLGLEAV